MNSKTITTNQHQQLDNPGVAPDVVPVITPDRKVVEEIHKLHMEIVGHAQTTLKNAILIGKILSKEKVRVGHGNWLPYVYDNLPFNERTARNYMQVYANRERLLKSEKFSDLILSKAYARLKQPRQTSDDPHIPILGITSDPTKITDIEADVMTTDAKGNPSAAPDDLSGPGTASAVPVDAATSTAPEPTPESDTTQAAPASDTPPSASTASTSTEYPAAACTAAAPAIIQAAVAPVPAASSESFDLADGTNMSVEWHPGVISPQQVREELQRRHCRGIDPVNFPRQQKFYVEFANHANALSGETPSSSEIDNLREGADWMASQLYKICEERRTGQRAIR